MIIRYYNYSFKTTEEIKPKTLEKLQVGNM